MNLILFKSGVFLSAFLLFQIQLILGKTLLPGFGGGYLVWGISIVFYQGLLFLGYLHLHLLNRNLAQKTVSRWFGGIMALSLFLLPVPAERLANPSYGIAPEIEIVLLLGTVIGIPFFLLSGFSIYAQLHLASSSLPERENPYVLYASSNLGAFAALLSYPFLVEPNLDLEAQKNIWQIGYGVLAALVWVLILKIPTERGESSEPLAWPAGRRIALWLLLSAAPSALFLAVTNAITFDIAPVPLLWIPPLALYLLTMILAFKRTPFCPAWMRACFYPAVALGTLLFSLKLTDYSVFEWLSFAAESRGITDFTAIIAVEPALQLALCFVVCLVCHHRLSENRPENHGHLTVFYITLSLGGFLGGAAVNWFAPALFNFPAEEPLALLLAVAGLHLIEDRSSIMGVRQLLIRAAVALAIIALFPDTTGKPEEEVQAIHAAWLMAAFSAILFLIKNNYRYVIGFLAALILMGPLLPEFRLSRNILLLKRNFYGIYQVYEKNGFRYFRHGTTLHGAQFLDPSRRKEALTYYHRESPVGALLAEDPFRFSRVALVGLGAGSLATYAKPGQAFDVFELDPLVGEIARSLFSFLKDSAGQIREVYGDARLRLKEEPGASYDAMVIDVFNSGSIPVHLLTVEAMRDYLRLLKPGGILFLHVSNQFLDLIPVVYANATTLKLHPSLKYNPEKLPPQKDPTLWIALTPDPAVDFTLRSKLGWQTAKPPAVRPWTDRFSSIVSHIY